MDSESSTILDVTSAAGFQTWRMQFGAVNALNPLLLEALHRQVDAATADDSVAVVVLTSGLKIFSAGGDAAWMAEILQAQGKQGLVDEFNRTMDVFRELCIRLRRSPFLVVAAMNGHTLAGGLELAAACDLRFSSSFERLQIGVPEMDLFGAVPTGGGGAQFLTRILGPSRALDFILQAKPVSPETALAMGLVDRLYDGADLIGQTEAFAADVARKAGRIGVSSAKRSVLGGWEMPLGDAMEFDRSVHWDAMRRGNFLPGVEGFVQRFGGGK